MDPKDKLKSLETNQLQQTMDSRHRPLLSDPLAASGNAPCKQGHPVHMGITTDIQPHRSKLSTSKKHPLESNNQGQETAKQPRMSDQKVPHATSSSSSDVPMTIQSMEQGTSLSTIQHEGRESQRLKCPLCSEYFKDPRLLNCLHSFCLKCLQDQVKSQGGVGTSVTLNCPLCEQSTELPTWGVSGLLQDIPTCFLVEEETLKRSSQIMCQGGDEHHPAVFRCSECNDFLCTDCYCAHQLLSKMKSHKVVSIADLQSGKAAFKSKIESDLMQCQRHVGQELSFFCDTCQVPICLMCTALDHSKPDHKYIDLTTAQVSCQNDIDRVLNGVKKNHKELLLMRGRAEEAKNKLDSSVKETLQKILHKKKLEVQKLQRREKTLKDRVMAANSERQGTLEACLAESRRNLDQMGHILQKVADIKSYRGPICALLLKKKVLENLERASSIAVRPVPLHLSFMDFRPIESHASGQLALGDLLLEKKWKLKQEIRRHSEKVPDFKWAKGVAVYSNGDIVVADAGNSSVSVFTSKGVKKSALISDDPKGALNSPIDVAISSSDSLLVLDTNAVKVFNKDSKFLHVFALFDSGTSSNSYRSCIDVGSSKIAVGVKSLGTILLFDEKGAKIKQIPTKLIDNHLAICTATQSLIYTNYQKSKLVSVNFSGEENFIVDTMVNGKCVKPTGVCSDRNGDIFVAVHAGAERGSGQICHYSSGGQYIECVAARLYNPMGLAFTPKGDLVVADRESVKIFHIK